MKLTVRIKIAAWGKGWYKLSLPVLDAASDDAIRVAVKRAYPEVSGVQITREYPVQV